MERLQFGAIGRQYDSTVGENAIDVEDEQFDAGGFGQHGWIVGHAHAACLFRTASAATPIKSVMSSKPAGRPASSTTGNSLIFRRRTIVSASITRAPIGTVMGRCVITSRIGRSR